MLLYSKQFFTSTESLGRNIVVCHLKLNICPYVQSVKLASLEGGLTSQTASASDLTAPLPAESMRCAGPCAIGGVREGMLWLIDARGRPFVIPLSHAGLKARIAAAQGDAKTARIIAEAGE